MTANEVRNNKYIQIPLTNENPILHAPMTVQKRNVRQRCPRIIISTQSANASWRAVCGLFAQFRARCDWKAHGLFLDGKQARGHRTNAIRSQCKLALHMSDYDIIFVMCICYLIRVKSVDNAQFIRISVGFAWRVWGDVILTMMEWLNGSNVLFSATESN